MRTMIALFLGLLVIAACVAPLTVPEQTPPPATAGQTLAPETEAESAVQPVAALTATPELEAEGAANAAVPAQAATPAAASTADLAEPDNAIAEYLANCLICGPTLADYSGPLEAQEVRGLLLALNDEYHAVAVYTSVMEEFGEVRPFVNIRRAEYNHVDALTRLFDAYRVPLPDNPWLGQVDGFAGLQEACSTGVAAEIANRDLYTVLFDSTERTDITRVYEALQSASEENHLPAFQRCAGL